MTSGLEILFGKIAVHLGFASGEDIERCAQLQAELGDNLPIGELLVSKGIINEEQLAKILEYQISNLREITPEARVRKEDYLFGKIAVRQKYVSQAEMNSCIREHAKRLHGGSFIQMGRVCVERGALTDEQVAKVVAIQRKTVYVCPNCLTANSTKDRQPGEEYNCKKCGKSLSIQEETIQISSSAIISATPTLESTGSADKADALSFEEKFIGKEYANHRIVKKLGHGGMGAVYLAEHVSLDQKRAIKILPSSFANNKVYIARFFQEARSVAKIQHSNIIQVHDAGESSGFYYLIMEFVDGMDLGQIMKRDGVFKWQDVVPILLQVLEAFKAAHEKNIIHRDIKPDNIMINSKNVVKVADFGLAKTMGESSGLTHTGQIMGTPYYMSPEQCQGNAMDARTDIYSLGATVYMMLTGKPMFVGATPIAIIHKHVYESPEHLHEKLPGVPKEFSDVVMKMLEKDPTNRYSNADTIVKELSDLDARFKEESSADTISVKDIHKGKVDAPVFESKSSVVLTAVKKKPYLSIGIVLVLMLVAGLLAFVFMGGSTIDSGEVGTHLPEVQAEDEITDEAKFFLIIGEVESKIIPENDELVAIPEELMELAHTDDKKETLSDLRERVSAHNERIEAAILEKEQAEAEKQAKGLREEFENIVVAIEGQINDGQYKEYIVIPSEVDSLVVTDDDRSKVRALRRQVAAYNDEVDRRREEAEFIRNLEQAHKNRDWSAIRQLLNDRDTLTEEQQALRVRAEVERYSEPFIVGGKRIVLGIYEVTNLQFRDFIESGGYTDKEYWSEAGWNWKVSRNITKPAFWDDTRFNGDMQPVVGVSYYEAEAYARWAGARLPTEAEWLAAAGDSWRRAEANTRESLKSGTVAVGSYDSSTNPLRCFDMLGNAMEWVAPLEAGRASCYGCSWRSIRSEDPQSSRFYKSAHSRTNCTGFRVAREK